jgi:hypothetical protein
LARHEKHCEKEYSTKFIGSSSELEDVDRIGALSDSFPSPVSSSGVPVVNVGAAESVIDGGVSGGGGDGSVAALTWSAANAKVEVTLGQ